MFVQYNALYMDEDFMNTVTNAVRVGSPENYVNHIPVLVRDELVTDYREHFLSCLPVPKVC